jgi:hypothetical protein
MVQFVAAATGVEQGQIDIDAAATTEAKQG